MQLSASNLVDNSLRQLDTSIIRCSIKPQNVTFPPLLSLKYSLEYLVAAGSLIARQPCILFSISVMQGFSEEAGCRVNATITKRVKEFELNILRHRRMSPLLELIYDCEVATPGHWLSYESVDFFSFFFFRLEADFLHAAHCLPAQYFMTKISSVAQ